MRAPELSNSCVFPSSEILEPFYELSSVLSLHVFMFALGILAVAFLGGCGTLEHTSTGAAPSPGGAFPAFAASEADTVSPAL